MTADEFRAALLRETAALGQEPSVEAIRAAVARLEALDAPKGAVSHWRSGLMLLEGMAEMGWPSAPERSAEEQAEFEAYLRSTPE